MKKSLIALAVLAASGAAMAQSSVQVYGLLDVAVGSQKDANGVTTTKVLSGGVDGDRWGIKGSEDLGGGLKANFKLEQGLNIDTGAVNVAGQAFSRYSYVGFSGAFGEVQIGKTGTAYDYATGGANAVFNSALSAESNTWKSISLYNWNPANSIYYVTPSYSGFTAAVSYALGENKTALVDSGSNVAFNVQYANGPVFAALGYQVEKATGSAQEVNFTNLNGSYDFGAAKLDLAYGKVANSGAVAGADTTEYQVGVDVPVSSVMTVSANYANSKDNATAGDARRTGYGLGVKYDLSKRTFVYGGYRAEKNDQGGAGDINTNLFAVGVHHTF